MNPALKDLFSALMTVLGFFGCFSGVVMLHVPHERLGRRYRKLIAMIMGGLFVAIAGIYWKFGT
jgi:hypothetical protein